MGELKLPVAATSLILERGVYDPSTDYGFAKIFKAIRIRFLRARWRTGWHRRSKNSSCSTASDSTVEGSLGFYRTEMPSCKRLRCTCASTNSEELLQHPRAVVPLDALRDRR